MSEFNYTELVEQGHEPLAVLFITPKGEISFHSTNRFTARQLAKVLRLTADTLWLQSELEDVKQ